MITKMHDLLVWLQSVEQLASTLYSEAAAGLTDEPELANFLHRLAEDEALHFHLLGSALNLFAGQGKFPEPALAIDPETRAGIETPLRTALARLRAGNCDRRELLAVIVAAEFSEWNRIFLYVLATCGQHAKEFQKISSLIQAHERRITKFFQGLPEGEQHLERLGQLPPVWRHRILVVDDEDELREIFCHVLAREGEVAQACNGREALDLTASRHYDAIVTDINMPELTGVDFARAALAADPELAGRFIFVTGGMDEEAFAFSQEHQVPLLRKPFSLTDLRGAIRAILDSGWDRRAPATST